MELQEGVNLHFIESSKFTTNRIRVRFAAAMSEKTVAGRVLLANLLEMGNQDYPTARQLRMKLAAFRSGPVLSLMNQELDNRPAMAGSSGFVS